MRIAVIGSGFTGLTLGFYLSNKDYQIDIFEKNSYIGGLASGIKQGQWYIDKFYHHIFNNDYDIISLAKDLGFKDLWLWKKCTSPILFNKKIYPFTTPIDLLKFDPISFKSRLQTGFVTALLKISKNPQGLEKQTAPSWLRKYMGKESYKVVWEPLLQKKFGPYYKQVSAAWIAARIYKRTAVLGYPKGGFQIIINKLSEKIKAKGNRIILNRRINNLKELKSYDKIIFTGANEQFIELCPNIKKVYQDKLKSINYISSIGLLLTLKQPLLEDVYWLNINDKNIPFVGLIQQTEFINKRYYNNFHPVYLIKYLDSKTEEFKQSKKEIYKNWINHLTEFNSKFKENWIEKYYIFKELYTQPIFKAGAKKDIAEFKTPVKNVYLINMAQIFPWDRGINYAVQLAKKLINMNIH